MKPDGNACEFTSLTSLYHTINADDASKKYLGHTKDSVKSYFVHLHNPSI